MAKVKVETMAVVNANPIGSVVEVDEKEAKWLEEIGYAKKVEDKKSAKSSTKKSESDSKSTSSAKSKKDEEKSEDTSDK